MNRSFLLLTTILCLFEFGVKAQNYDPSKIIPPSPTAAALGAYGNYQIGYHTGTPSITIPLYTIKSHDNSLDIILSYNASGIRVAQDASWVGLGWSLMAGGVITKTIRGYDDFKDAGAYYNSGAIPASTTTGLPNPGDRPAFDEVVNGRSDMEPDLYNYNFGPYSGRFVLGKSVDGSKVYVDKRNNLRIQYNGNWVITDAKGFTYNFTIVESASNYAYSSSAAQVTPTTDLSSFAFESLSTTSYYLTSIVSPNNDVITFNYTRGTSLSVINMSETQYDRNTELASCLFRPPYSQAQEQFLLYYKMYNASRQLNNELYLASITYSNGSIEFNTTDRKDIDYYDVNKKPQKLSSIVIYDKDHQPLKTYTMSYTYFKDNPAGTVTATDLLRLKLDAVTEAGKTGTTTPPYKFSYFNADDLPGKYSKDIDHWGFYNAALNQRLLPMPSNLRNSGYYATDDANREPDLTHLYIKEGVLSSIQYPTGGHTDFDFELNDYGHLPPNGATVDKGVGYVVNANPFDQSNTTISFDINPQDVDPNTQLAPGSIHYQYTYVSGTHLFAGVVNNYGNLTGPTGVAFNNDIVADPNGISGFKSQPLLLPVGHYVLYVRYIQGYSVSANLNFTIKVPVTQKQGGGLRVKSIINYDNTGASNIKRFLYTNADGSSSGRLLQQPNYGFKCPLIEIVGMSGCNPTSMYTYRTSGSVYPPGLASPDGTVGYDLVTELIGQNGEAGKTEYYYLNKEDWMLGPTPMPGIPALSYELNGSLAKQIVYNAAGQVLKSIENSYTLKDATAIPAAVIYKGPPIPNTFTFVGAGDMPTFTVNNGNPYNVYFYNSKSNWTVLESTRETNTFYTAGVGSSVVSDTYNYYDNPLHLQLTRQTIAKSDKKILTMLTNYADDYPAGTPFIDDMKTANQTSIPIEQVTYQNDGTSTNIINGQITKYKTGGKGLIDQIYKLEIAAPKPLAQFKFSNSLTGSLPSLAALSPFAPATDFKPKTTFNQFDDSGNPLVITPTDQLPAIFIWSYKKQYPIAMIKNSDYATVVSLLGGTTAVDNFANTNPTAAAITAFLAPLKNNAAMVNAFITTYTYEPMTGMTSSTDAKGETRFYEYDDLQRLMNIKDKDGNIIKHMDYHYAQ